MNIEPLPLVVQYLYVHGEGEEFSYPTTRSARSAAQVANRYLECALTQAASLRLRDVACDLALVTNIADRALLGRAGARLMERIESLGVAILPTEYLHRPVEIGARYASYVSSRYVLDAILAASAGQPPERQLWLTDLDCVWPDAQRVFAAAPPAPGIGFVEIPYPPDWDAVGFDAPGRHAPQPRRARAEHGRLHAAAAVGRRRAAERPAGAAARARQRVRAARHAARRTGNDAADRGADVDARRRARPRAVRGPSDVARRILTGPRHGAPVVEDPLDYGLWHLPSEKGLSLRRAANELLAGRPRRLRRDLAEPQRAARRFNVAGTGLARRVRDDGWLAAQRLRRTLPARLGGA